jgi:Flp pilus assembly pilin Flp
MRARCAAAWEQDEGQALVEYSLILALVAVGLVAVLLLFRDNLGGSYGRVGHQVDAAGLPVASPGGGTPGAGSPGGGGEPGYTDPGGAGGKGDHGCGGGHGGGLGQGGGGGCGGGGDR